MTPGEFRSGGANAEIRFAIGQCSLGSILVAASEKGVCAIMLGDDPEALLADLHGRFARTADRRRPGVRGVDGQGDPFVEAPSSRWELPLDIRGTAFQHRVWEALRDIRRARRRATPRSRSASAGRRRCAPSRRRAAQTLWPWRSRATASSGATARSPAIAGASSASASCSRGRPRNERGRSLAGQAGPAIAQRVAGFEWSRIGEELDTQGFAVLDGLLARQDCRALAQLYPQDALFRSRIVMARHGFGRGEYKYFAPRCPTWSARADRALSASGRDRQPLDRAWAPRRGIRPITPPSCGAVTKPARRARHRSSCATGRATSTACTRTSTANTSSRCRSPSSSSRNRARTSRAGNSC